MSTYYSLITNIGLINHANAANNLVKIDLTQMAVGDSNGAYYDPDGSETALQNELHRVNLTHVVIDENNPNQLIVEAVIEEVVGPFYIREVGIFDSNGDLFAIGKYPETFKPNLPTGSGKRLYIRMILGFANAPSVNLIINNDINLDPNFSTNVNNELNNRLKISENLADLTDIDAAKSNLGIGNSQEGFAGLIELATQEEVDTKTDDSKALTAKKLADQVDFSQINQNSTSKFVAKLPISRTSRQAMAVIMKDGGIKIWGRGYANGNTDGGGGDHYLPINLAVDPENPPTTKFTQVTLAAHSGFALDEEGKVYSWGYNAQGHLGHGDTVEKPYAKRIEYFVSNNIQIKEIITFNEIGHNDVSAVFFITTNNHVYGCGDNQQGVLGDGTTTNRYTPIRIGTLENVVQVVLTCGNAGTAYFRTDDGAGNKELWVTGWNANGQLGVGHTSRVTIPTKISPFNNVSHVAACGGVDTAGSSTYGSAILIDSGKVYTTGYGGHGQLGHGNGSNLSTWTEVANLSGIVDAGMVGTPYTTTYIIDSGGNILLCGYNGYGQLGLGHTSNSSVFVSPNGGDLGFQGNIKKVLLAGDKSYQDIIILDNDGQIYGSGYGYYGSLSRGGYANYNHTAFKKAMKSKIASENRKCIDITSAGYSYYYCIFALYDDGTLRVTGHNHYGMQGYGSHLSIHSKTYNDVTF